MVSRPRNMLSRRVSAYCIYWTFRMELIVSHITS